MLLISLGGGLYLAQIGGTTKGAGNNSSSVNDTSLDIDSDDTRSESNDSLQCVCRYSAHGHNSFIITPHSEIYDVWLTGFRLLLADRDLDYFRSGRYE